MLPNFKVVISSPFSWINPIISVIGIIIGILIIWWQIKKNHQQSLNLELYKQLIERISSAYTKIIRANTTIQALPFDISCYWDKQRDIKLNPEPIKTRSNTLILLNSEAMQETIKLFSVLECYEIAIPSFRIFKDMIHIQSELLGKKFNALFVEAIKFLPIDISEEQSKKLGLSTPIIPLRPDGEQSYYLKRLARDYCEVSTELIAYIYDLSITAQNQILGDLFGRTLPPRKPKSEGHFVITTEPSKIKDLEEHIERLKESLNN